MTGRAGKRGMALTFVSGRDIYKLNIIERFTRTRIHRGKMPTIDEVEGKKADVRLDKVRSVLNGDSFKSQIPFVDRLLEEGFSSTDIAAAVLQILIGPSQEPAPQRDSKKAPAIRPSTPAPSHAIPAAPAAAMRPLDIPPSPEHASHRRDVRPVRSGDDEPTPVLCQAQIGSQWMRLSIGWRDNATPRAIVDLLVAELGVPAPGVGMINLTHTQSFAQVKKQYLDKLANGPVSAATTFGPVQLTLIPCEKFSHKSHRKPAPAPEIIRKKHHRHD